MSEKIQSETMSRRTVLSVLVAALGSAATTVLAVSDAEAQTIGMHCVTIGEPVAMKDVRTGAQGAANGVKTGAPSAHQSSCAAPS